MTPSEVPAVGFIKVTYPSGNTYKYFLMKRLAPNVFIAKPMLPKSQKQQHVWDVFEYIDWGGNMGWAVLNRRNPLRGIPVTIDCTK